MKLSLLYKIPRGGIKTADIGKNQDVDIKFNMINFKEDLVKVKPENGDQEEILRVADNCLSPQSSEHSPRFPVVIGSTVQNFLEILLLQGLEILVLASVVRFRVFEQNCGDSCQALRVKGVVTF
jgi:hypothetical protein